MGNIRLGFLELEEPEMGNPLSDQQESDLEKTARFESMLLQAAPNTAFSPHEVGNHVEDITLENSKSTNGNAIHRPKRGDMA